MTTAPDGTKDPKGGPGSHQPALRALARFMPIRSVIEFGAGVFSTHLFLDPEAFPDLASLVTLESEERWINEVTVDDDRHETIHTPTGNFAAATADMWADFVFLDSAPMEARLKLIPHALSIAPIFGIHDCQVAEVRVHIGRDCKYIVGFGRPALTVFASDTTNLSELTT